MPATPRNVAPATLVSLAVILALALVCLVALNSADAAPGQPSCGDTITTDTTLHHNLVNCPNNGIIVGADDVTLDLNYHRIDGNGTPTAGCTGTCDVGVDIDGHDGVTVVHGSVRQFGDGVIARAARHTRLLGVSSSSNQFSAIVVSDSDRSVVRNSSGIGSYSDVGAGIFVVLSDQVRIVHSSFRGNAFRGIDVFESTHTLIARNRVSRNKGDVLEGAGIALEGSDLNRVRGNSSVRDGDAGITLSGKRNVIVRNRVFHPHASGPGEGVAIEVRSHQGNVIAHNTARDTEGDAIRVGASVRVVGTVVRRNRIPGAGEDGVHVDHVAKDTRLRGNHAFGANDDGLDVESRSTTLIRNEGRRNGDLGIEAVRGVIDGGGNKASGNGDRRQCTHIVCR
jgi:hypothetical protein